MVIQNIIAGIITAVIYGIILLGCIVPIIFMVRTKHNTKKFGYKKYMFIIVGLEALLLLSAVLVLFLLSNSFYNSIVWNKQGIGFPIGFFIALYQLMLQYILPVYCAIILVAACIRRWGRKVYEHTAKEQK